MASQSDSTNISSSSVAPSRLSPSPSPCPTLRAIMAIRSTRRRLLGTRSSHKLVFFLRAAFLECPSAHLGCSASFTRFASLSEKRIRQPVGPRLDPRCLGRALRLAGHFTFSNRAPVFNVNILITELDKQNNRCYVSYHPRYAL